MPTQPDPDQLEEIYSATNIWLGLFLKVTQSDVVIREIGFYIAVYDTSDNSLEYLDRPKWLDRKQYGKGWPTRWDKARVKLVTSLEDHVL